MPRIHLFEIHDQPWCPNLVRDALTDFLAQSETYKPVLPIILEAATAHSIVQAIDLCSGGGGPWIDWLPSGASHPIQAVILTDKFPNSDIANKRFAAGLTYWKESIDATAVPTQLRGFRTLFTSFHHFRRNAARRILLDACLKGQPIGIFEFTRRNLSAVLLMLFSIIPVWIAVAKMRPVKVSRIFFTYLIPVIPFVVTFDGIVSCLRTYSPSELLAMVSHGEFAGFEWKAGVVRKSAAAGFPITYLIGVPKKPIKRNGS